MTRNHRILSSITKAKTTVLTLLSIGFLFLQTVAAQTNRSPAVSTQLRDKPPAVRLEPGKSLEKELAGGATDSYEIQVPAGQFLHAIVDQKGIDVALALYGPDGKQIATMDSPNGSYGLEQISTIAESTGAYRLDIVSDDKNARAGRYRVSVNPMHAPTEADRGRLSAEHAFVEAVQMWLQGTADSLRRCAPKYEAILPLWRTSGDIYEEALTLQILGEIYSDLGDNQKALDYYYRALPLLRSVGDRRLEALTLNETGVAYGHLGEMQNALNCFNQALPLAQAVGDRRDESNALNNLAFFYGAIGDKEKSLDYQMSALRVVRDAGDRPAEALTLNNIGANYRDLGEEQKALDYYSQALMLARALGYRELEAGTLNNMGEAWDDLGERQKALDYLSQSLAIRQSLGNIIDEAQALSNIGLVYEEFGENQKALDYYVQALPLRHSAGDRLGESVTLNNIASVYESLGDQQKAVDFFNKALALKRDVSDRQGESGVLTYLATIYSELGDNKKAIELCDQAAAIARAVGARKEEAYALNQIGVVYTRLGDCQTALDFFHQALAVHASIGDRGYEAVTLNDIGNLFSALGNVESAIQSYSEALALAAQVRSPVNESITLTGLMRLWRRQGQPATAAFFGKQAVNKIQQLRANIRGLDKDTQRTFLKSKEETYRELADLLITQGRLPEAQQVLDLLKNEEYFDFIRRDSKSASSLTAPLNLTKDEESVNREYEANAESITAIGNEYAALRAKTDRTPEEEKHLGELSEQLKAANAAWEKFLSGLYAELRKEKSTEEARKEEAHVKEQAFGMQRVVRQLNDRPGHGVVALYTLVGQEKYRVIVVTSNVMVAREYPISAEELRNKVFEFRDVLTHPKSDPVPKAQELYRILVAPVAADLAGAKAETLMWSLDDVLRYLPIAALHDDSDYLVAKYRNEVFTPENEASLGERPDIASWRGLGMGVSKSYGDFSPLPSVPDELHRIIRDQSVPAAGGVLPGQTMLDDTFTTQNMKKALERNFPLVHIASHFDFSPGNDTNSFLLLGGKDPNGEHLTLAEIRDDPAFNFADTELLTLSACNTAVGGIAGDGREIDGLGNVAQEKGAKAVVASLWGVYDPSTGVLMQEFYKRWTTHKGMPKAEALREAQLALLRGAPASGNGANGRGANQSGQDSHADFSHPYYWAPFILIGNWK